MLVCKIMKSRFDYTNLEQIHSRKLLNLSFKQVFNTNNPTMTKTTHKWFSHFPIGAPLLARPSFHRAHCVPQEGGRVQGWESVCWGVLALFKFSKFQVFHPVCQFLSYRYFLSWLIFLQSWFLRIHRLNVLPSTGEL